MVLVDTSSWIETLRHKGDVTLRERIRELVIDGKAAWCDVVRLELWNGVRAGPERRELDELETVVHRLEIDDVVWARAMELSKRSRAHGLTVGVADLVIVATAKRHAVEIESRDQDIHRLLAMKI